MQKYRTFGRSEEPQVEEGDEKVFGINNRLAPEQLRAGLCVNGENVRMRDGLPTTRLGTVRPGWLNVTRASIDALVQGVDGFYGAGSFRDPNGREWLLTAADGGIFRHLPHNGRVQLSLPTNVRILSDCTFCQAFNVVYCFRGRHVAPLVMDSIDTGFEDLVQRWDSADTYNAAIAATGQEAEEIAYGPFQSISSLTAVGDLATCVTTLEHGYVTGADVVIQGATETGYNGRWNITVVDASTFTFNFPGASGSPATGTPVVSNMANYWRALGSRVTLTSLTSVGTTATATKNNHGFTTGQYVTISGAVQTEYNGTYAITVTGANTFTYTFAGSATTPATGTILARTSIVLAGQSPDTNAEAWTRVYNVLPNCDEGIFVNNRVLASTAYTPGDDDYDSTSAYTKTDFVVSLDIGDLVHFDFVNEFRINQGGDDEIVKLLKGPSGSGTGDAVVVVKGKSWGLLLNVRGDLSDVSLEMHMDGYGGCGRNGVVAGKDVIFVSSGRGVVSLRQYELGAVRSVDVPFSNDVPTWIGRINWTLGDKIRVGYWDDKLYVAVPLDDGRLTGKEIVPSGAVYSSGLTVNVFYAVTLEVGQTYEFVMGNASELSTDYTTTIAGTLLPGGTEITASGTFTAEQPTYYIWGGFGMAGATVTASVRKVLAGVNNAVMVYDYRSQRGSADPTEYDFQSGQWVSLDVGQALCVKEFFRVTYNGQERLGYVGEDGWANLMEQSDAGDQVVDPESEGGLAFEEIVLDWTSRGYRLNTNGQKKWKWLELVLGVWNALFDVWKGNCVAGTSVRDETLPMIEDKSFSRTKYLKPAGKADYVEGNENGDFLTAGRGDYSMDLATDLTPGDGLGIVFQEVAVRQSVRTLAGRYAQFRVRCTRGRMKIKAVEPTAAEGNRRAGILI